MTDKQIIIDDVEVYKCANAKRSIFGIDVECRLGGDCSQNPNCYYKQLKRKEQECDQLRGGQRDQNKVIKELKAELEKEKALKQTYLTCYKTKHGDVKSKLFKYETYKQTLTEIKEVAERINNEGIYGYVITDELDKIIQKCEVIKDE